MKIIVLNAGSSTLKFGVFEKTHKGILSVEKGIIEHDDYASAVKTILEKVSSESIDVIACRVVHGGEKFSQPVTVTEKILEDIRSLNELAPLHNPIDVQIIEACQKILPTIPIVAVFDTAFHHTLPEVASTYAISKKHLEPSSFTSLWISWHCP